MRVIKKALAAISLCLGLTTAYADQVLIIDAQYSTVTQNVQGRLEAAGHTVTTTTSTAGIPTGTGTYQQVWDLRYSAALTAGEQTAYQSFVTSGGFAYFVTENPGCCMARNSSVAALVTALGGGTTDIGPGWANNVETNMNTTYMTAGLTVNYLAVAAIVNSQGIPLISDADGNVSGMSWIGRANAMGSGVLGTIVTVADTNWLAQSWGTDNQQALDDIIRGIVAGTVGGTISAQGNGAAASNGAAQQQAQNQTPSAPTTFDHTNTGETVTTNTMASGTFTGGGGILRVDAGATTVTNNIILDPSMIIDENSLNSTFSGVFSGTGSLTIRESGAGGSVTLSATNTYTGSTTVETGATLNNTGSIATSSGVNNAGTFNNSGTAPNVNNTGTFNNSGTAGDVNNSGTTTNSGTVAAVTNTGFFTNLINGITGMFTNSGTASNAGTVGAVTNTGTFNNTGVAGDVANNSGTFTNSGTAGSVTNAGTVNNSGTVGAVTNTGTFNVTDGGSTGAVTNSGQLTFSGSGSLLSVANTGTFDFTGSGTSGTVDNYGIFNFTGAGIVGDVNNTGTFNYNGTGAVGTVTNGGVFNVSNAGQNVTVPNYTQTGDGVTLMTVAPGTIQQMTVTGTANLAGGIAFQAAPGPYQYGVYNFLTAQQINGSYSYLGILPDNISPLGFALEQTGTSVGLKITPSALYTLGSIENNVGSMLTVNNLQMSVLGGAMNYDCTLYGERNMCISAGARFTTDSAGNVSGGSLTFGKKLNPNVRVGAFVDQGFGNITSGNVTMKAGLPMIGAYAHWSQDSRGYGWGVHGSLGYASNSMTINRTATPYSEAGTGSPKSSGEAVQVKATYTYPLGTRLTINPYAGIRYTQINVNGYTESNAQYPLTYNGLTQSATDALAGVGASYNFGRVVASISAGVVQNLNYTAGSLSGTSGIVNLGSYNVALPGSNYTSASLGAGLSIDVARNQYLNLGMGWQQKSLVNTNVSSFNASYTVGF